MSLLAEQDAGRLAGFSFALLCRTPEDGAFWWSHLTLITHEAQGKDTHFQLKLAQRKDALENAIHEIRWTVDPLLATSAHLNPRKPGAVSHVLEENAYGYPPALSNEVFPRIAFRSNGIWIQTGSQTGSAATRAHFSRLRRLDARF